MAAVVKNTLFVRNFSPELTEEDKEDFLRHFGATNVRCMAESASMRNSAFAVFPSEDAAEQALLRLHQLDVLGRRLQVQLARNQDAKHFPHLSDFKRPEFPTKEIRSDKNDYSEKMEALQRDVNSIAVLFGLNYPLNPKLRYEYPPPSATILTNIAHALIAVPKFYTQVLHLMNKLNLPAPFGELTEEPSLDEAKKKRKHAGGEQETSESELESDEDEKKWTESATSRYKTQKRPIKRPKLFQLMSSLNKTRETQNQAPTNAPEDRSAVFETTDTQATKKIEFKLALSNILQTTENKNDESLIDVAGGGFGQFAPIPAETSMTQEENKTLQEQITYFTREEIRRKRISNEGMKDLQVFKNYEAGEPTSRLYIKNLAKVTEEDDLKKVYGGYIDETNEMEKNLFFIRVMKDGRMKGQAFVTLPTAEKAKMALEDSNGFLLHDKPLVVQYARSAKPKEEAKSSR